MSRLKPNLVVVAHPDDETIFFAGLILSERKRPWHLICVSDGNSDGRGSERRQELWAAAKKLKVDQVSQWDFPDVFDRRFEIKTLVEKLKGVGPVNAVYTHSIIGDYGHPHHQDVSYGVHKAFQRRSPVWSVAYNCHPDKIVNLSRAHFKIKAQILNEIYGHEIRRFVHLLPATFSEGFVRLGQIEIEAIYNFVRHRKPLNARQLKHFRWLFRSLTQAAYAGMERPF